MRASKVGIEIDIYKKLPLGTGLGSSASSAAAAVMVVNELLRRPLSKRELVPFAVLGEMGADGALHGDNVIPSLLGGVILIRDIRELDYHRVYHPENLYLSVVLPNVSVLTREARQILKDAVPMKKWVRQSGNLGGLLLGLQNSDFDLIERSMQDHIIEPQRAHLIPHFYEIQAAAIEAGALGCSISGSGPTIFALTNERLRAEMIGVEMQRIFNQNKIDSRLYVSAINDEGAVLC
jgi:homoserine kinase